MLVLLVFASVIGQQPDDTPQTLEFLRLSYKANKDSFAYGAFRFQFTRGTSASLVDAESEVFTKAFEETGYYVFDGDNGRYELIAAPEVLAAATTRINERRSSSSIMAFRSLTDGRFTLRDNLQPQKASTSLLHAATIFPGTDEFYRPDTFEFPLYLGDKGGSAYDLFADLTALKDGKLSLAELDMDARLDGLKVCKFSYTWKNGKRTYWIDVDRGTVPLRILDHYNPNNLDINYIFSELEHVPNAGWLPRRRIHVLGQGSIVDRIVITEIDTRNKPRESEFRLDFPEPVTCFDTAKKLLYGRRKSWSLLNLPGPSSAGTNPVIPFLPPPELPGEVEAFSVWAIVSSVVVVLLLMAGSALVLLRRMNRTHGA